MRWRVLILALTLAAATAACGKKGPPRPPLPPFPADAPAPQARQAGDSIEVQVGLPSRLLDGAPITALAGLRLFRQSVPAPEGLQLPAPSVLPGDAPELVRALGDGELAALPPGSAWVYRESLQQALGAGDPSLRHRLVYSVRYLVRGRHWSPHSPPAVVFTGPPVEAPGGLSAQAANAGVVLRWQPAASGLPTAVFRRAEDGVFPFAPLTVVPAGVGQWLDPTVAVGRTYDYLIRAQAEGAPDRLSAAAGPVSVAMEDSFPPLSPQGLQALERAGGVDLFWRAGTEIDLGGYRVWRRSPPAGPWELLTPEPLAGNSYSDATAAAGSTYEYAVSAVDSNDPPNESPRGDPVTAAALAPPPQESP